jgi:hypothetical protein
MSDTVRSLTWNDTATPANSSGANGFPFPIGAGPGTVGTNNPVKITFQDAIKWWWRVQNWNFDSSCVLVSGGGGVPDRSFVSGPMGPLGDNATRELGLIPNIGYGEGGHQWSADTTPFGGSGSASLSFLPNWLYDDPTNNVGNIWPGVGLNDGGGTPSEITNDNGSAVYLDTNPENLPEAATGSFTATIDGYDVTVYYYADIAPDSGDSFTPGSMTISPISYWPFAALADGSPIYDTTTGAQLQSPLD